MKSIPYIIQSYFQQGFHQVIGLVVSMLFLVITAMVLLFSSKADIGLCQIFMLLSLALIVSMVVLYISDVTSTDSCALVPHYRQRQLTAAGILLAPFLLIPVILLIIKGLPVARYLAMSLSLISLNMPYVGRADSDRYQSILLVPMWLIYELLGFEFSFAYIGSFSQITGFGSDQIFVWMVIGASMVVTVTYGKRFLSGRDRARKAVEKKSNDPSLRAYDKIDKTSEKLVRRKMSRLFARLRDGEKTTATQVQLFQYALFGPSFSLFLDMTVLTSSMVFVALMLAYFYNGRLMTFHGFAPFILLLYHMMAIRFTTDFLQHRDRLPTLWLQSQTSSRRIFSRTVLFTYLVAGMREYLKVTVIVFLFPIFSPFFARPEFLLLPVVGLLPFVVLMAFSMILSDEITSANCKGWFISNTLIGFPLVFISLPLLVYFDNTLPTWIFVLVSVFLSLLLLGFASGKWADKDMDFTGPESLL